MTPALDLSSFPTVILCNCRSHVLPLILRGHRSIMWPTLYQLLSFFLSVFSFIRIFSLCSFVFIPNFIPMSSCRSTGSSKHRMMTRCLIVRRKGRIKDKDAKRQRRDLTDLTFPPPLFPMFKYQSVCKKKMKSRLLT